MVPLSDGAEIRGVVSGQRAMREAMVHQTVGSSSHSPWVPVLAALHAGPWTGELCWTRFYAHVSLVVMTT